MKLAACLWLILSACLQAAGLEFSELVKDVNAPADAPSATVDFNFSNKSGKPVTINKADPGCSCLHVQIKGGKMLYAPGESGVIRMTFDMGNYSGTIEKVVGLWLDKNTSDTPSQSLTVRVHIPVLVNIEPKSVMWSIGAKPDSQTIQIRMAEGKPIRIVKVDATKKLFTTELKTIEEGKKYDLVVTPLATASAGMDVIRIETDCEIPKFKSQQSFAIIQKNAPPRVTKLP